MKALSPPLWSASCLLCYTALGVFLSLHEGQWINFNGSIHSKSSMTSLNWACFFWTNRFSPGQGLCPRSPLCPERCVHAPPGGHSLTSLQDTLTKQFPDHLIKYHSFTGTRAVFFFINLLPFKVVCNLLIYLVCCLISHPDDQGLTVLFMLRIVPNI